MKEINREIWRRFLSIAKPFWFSDEKKSARGLLLVLLVLMLAVNGLNVTINYVGGDFMTALSDKNAPKFFQLLFMYAGVFIIGTPIVVFYSWVQQKLGINWRRWMTNDLLERYFQKRAYYQINSNSAIDNPDERISQDVHSFTTAALSFALVILSSVFTLISFTAILWSISKLLVGVLVVYSIAGTLSTIYLGKNLIGLNFNQLRKEANFRYGLIHVRNNVESIAFYGGEEREIAQTRGKFAELFANFNMLIGAERNLNFLTTGYNYLVVIIPSMVIAPLYFSGKVHFGVISQADMAFSQVLGALSVVVTSFTDLTAFIAQTNRLSTFSEALETPSAHQSAGPKIEFKPSESVEMHDLSVQTPDYKSTLVKNLSAQIKPGDSILVMGPSGSGKSSLLRAIAGLWDSGSGSIKHPVLTDMLFLPQRPYMLLGTLRSQLLYPNTQTNVTDGELAEVLARVNLGDLAHRVGGLDVEIDWSNYLSVGEQQRLAFARVFLTKPKFAILDEATSALDVQNESRLYAQLRKLGTTYISVGHRPNLAHYHNQVLDLEGTGGWSIRPATQVLAAANSTAANSTATNATATNPTAA